MSEGLQLLSDIHTGMAPPPDCDNVVTCNNYLYYHYGCDGLDDSVSK